MDNNSEKAEGLIKAIRAAKMATEVQELFDDLVSMEIKTTHSFDAFMVLAGEKDQEKQNELVQCLLLDLSRQISNKLEKAINERNND